MKTLPMLCLLAAAVSAAEPQDIQLPEPELAPLTNLVWTLPPKYATLDGDRLVVDIPAGAYPASAMARAELPAAFFEDAKGFSMEISAEGAALAKPTKSYLGLKFQMRWTETATGRREWPNCRNKIGDFPATVLRNDAVFGDAHPDSIELQLGLQETSGRVVFDLSTLRSAATKGTFRTINGDWIVRYPPMADPQTTPAAMAANDDPRFARNDGHCGEAVSSLPTQSASSLRGGAAPVIAAQRRQPLRGVMLPQRDPTEEDFETLAEWGVTLVRYQMTRNWHGVGDNRDLEEFGAWLDGKLDCLEKVVIPCARKHGIKVVVDMHVTPGGRDAEREPAMFREKVYADAFVDAWRRIAARFKGNADAIYGYDLVNEPVQIGRAPFDWWTLQRLAAEAVREIDPNAPIVFETHTWDSPGAFPDLSPIRMDNVVYQVHFYMPGEFTHQGVHGPVGAVWPDPSKGWDRDYVRNRLAPVREFEKRHGAKIYVGEFSAIAWAKGADEYIRDCIAVFEEFGWDWTYHAFREWNGWSVEHEGPDSKHMVPSEDNPRKRALLDGFRGTVLSENPAPAAPQPRKENTP